MAGPRGRHRHGGGPLTLRSRADSQHLADVLQTGRSLLIVGAGFLGGEVAAAARARGLRVVLVEAQPLPLAGVLGQKVDRWVAGLHRRAGVDLRLEVGVRALLSDPSPTRNARRAAGAELSDGTLVHADAALAALGAVPNTAWLSGSGLQIDGGVVVDAWCLPLLTDGRPAQDLVAGGDVTRWPHPFAPE